MLYPLVPPELFLCSYLMADLIVFIVIPDNLLEMRKILSNLKLAPFILYNLNWAEPNRAGKVK